MFGSLDEQIETTEGRHLAVRERLVRLAGVAILSVLMFGGLYLVLVTLE